MAASDNPPQDAIGDDRPIVEQNGADRPIIDEMIARMQHVQDQRLAAEGRRPLPGSPRAEGITLFSAASS